MRGSSTHSARDPCCWAPGQPQKTREGVTSLEKGPVAKVLLGLLKSWGVRQRGDTGPGLHPAWSAHSLLFSFMNVHMSLSSGLCAKEQFPTYWHLRPFCAWMQSCGAGEEGAR